jgi:excisionase family DNA binding protein
MTPQTTTNDDERYLSIEKASVYLSLSVDSLYRRVSDQTIPFIKVGRRLLFDKRALDRWMTQKAKETQRSSRPKRMIA